MMQQIDTRSVMDAAWLEHRVLNHVKDALRVTLDWKVPSVGVGRKLSTLKFTLQSFQRHFERLMDLEEQDGYMLLVAERKPNLLFRVERLESDHMQFRKTVRRLMPLAETLSEFDPAMFEDFCDDVRELLERVDEHDAEEIQLLQEALLYDEGGEG